MINLKKGMTLAEILIVLGIVAVVATMGFTYAKKGTEKAYDMYVYTGYKGLSDAMNEARYQGNDLKDKNFSVNGGLTCDNDKFFKSIQETLHATSCERTSYKLNGLMYYAYTITTPNNISYKFWETDISDYYYGETFAIDMMVPSPKYTYIDDNGNTVVDNKKYYRFHYSPKFSNYIVPLGTFNDKDPNGIQRNRYISLRDRKDLLPFYIDNGIVGRIRPKGSTYEYEKITPVSFKEGYCKTKDLKWFDDHIEGNPLPFIDTSYKTLLNCDVGTRGSHQGVLKLLDPRKI